tara:strand:+ start:442 stop:567 length:126 start_codon:yes stop_codon:yes gene_type:complete
VVVNTTIDESNFSPNRELDPVAALRRRTDNQRILRITVRGE